MRRKSFHFAKDRWSRDEQLAASFHRLSQVAYRRPKWAQKAAVDIGCTDAAVKGWAYGTTPIPVEAASIVISQVRKRLASVHEEHAQAAEREEAELRAALADFERLARFGNMLQKR